MLNISRRTMIAQTLLASGALVLQGREISKPNRKWTLNLMPGMIGVNGNQREMIELAAKHGFESVEPNIGYLSGLSEQEMQEFLGWMKERKIVFGAAGLPVDFRQDDKRFEEGLAALPKQAQGLQRAGVTRMGTWLMPGHNTLTYLANLKQHGKRLAEIAKILADQNIRLGLEYVGTKTLRNRFKYEFVHSMAETKDLISEIGGQNVGFILDSWHWWQAGDTEEDIMTLKQEQIVAVDLNDAPVGIEKEKQQDGQRELPLSTGVIDVSRFMRALSRLQYDGPVRAEPFNKSLNELNNDDACSRTITALQKAAALHG